MAGVTAYVLNQTESVARQVGASGQALMQSQRLAKSVSPALGGNATALADVADSAAALAKATTYIPTLAKHIYSATPDQSEELTATYEELLALSDGAELHHALSRGPKL